MWNSDLNLIFGNLHTIGFLVLYTFLFSSLIGGVYTSTNASSDAYNSGYNHGCDDAEIFDVSKRYINQPEKGPSFHTETFMQGYYDGYDACTTTTSDGNIRLPGVETFRIDATIDFDRQAILESNGNNLDDA